MQIQISDDVESYANNRLFTDASEKELLIVDNPYRRPTRTFDNAFIDYEKPLTPNNQASNSALSTHRLLLNIYEADGVFLPKTEYSGFWQDFQDFYSDKLIGRAETIRGRLESKAFSFLNTDIDVSGPWTAKTAIEFFEEYLLDQHGKRGDRADTDPAYGET